MPELSARPFVGCIPTALYGVWLLLLQSLLHRPWDQWEGMRHLLAIALIFGTWTWVLGMAIDVRSRLARGLGYLSCMSLEGSLLTGHVSITILQAWFLLSVHAVFQIVIMDWLSRRTLPAEGRWTFQIADWFLGTAGLAFLLHWGFQIDWWSWFQHPANGLLGIASLMSLASLAAARSKLQGWSRCLLGTFASLGVVLLPVVMLGVIDFHAWVFQTLAWLAAVGGVLATQWTLMWMGEGLLTFRKPCPDV